MKWLKKLFKKDKMLTTEELQSLKESLALVPAYQWVKTELTGTVCYFSDITFGDGVLFVEFTDGSRINYNLLDEMMVKLDSVDQALDINTQPVSLNQPVNQIGQAIIRPVAAIKENPIHSLLKKQKPNGVGVDISLELNMPPKDLYKVLESSFDNAQDEIVEFIVADINIDNIRASVKEAIRKFYE